MTTVSVTEFRQHLAAWLDRVRAGEEVAVSDRGRLRSGTRWAPRAEVYVLDTSVLIARLTTQLGLHGDPADRIVAATAVHLGALLITADRLLRDAPTVRTLW